MARSLAIGVISDIHGNSLALDAVLARIEELGADKIFCLGDLSMAGYDPNYTVEKVRNLPNVTIIQGNTDKLIVHYSAVVFSAVQAAANAMAHALRDDVKIMKKENIEFLRELPEKLEVVEEGVKICLCHGSPRRQDENLFPDTPLNVVAQAVASTDADLIFCGHTHLPCGFQLESGQTVVNVGSVGRPMQDNKTPVFAFLTICNDNGNKTFEIRHEFVPYDNEAAAKKVMERGFPYAQDLADMLRKK